MGITSSRVPKNIKNLIIRIEVHLDALMRETDYSLTNMKRIVIKTQLLISQASVFFDAPKPNFEDYYNQSPPRFEEIDHDIPITFTQEDEKVYESSFKDYMEVAVAYLQMFICD